MIRLDGSQPVRYGLKLEVDEKYRALRQSLSQLCGIAKSNLLLVEMYGSMIRVRRRERDGEGRGGEREKGGGKR